MITLGKTRSLASQTACPSRSNLDNLDAAYWGPRGNPLSDLNLSNVSLRKHKQHHANHRTLYINIEDQKEDLHTVQSPKSFLSYPACFPLILLSPTRLRLVSTKDHLPVEEWWENRGHKIHLDHWRNQAAKVKVILHHGVGTNGRQMSMILGVPLRSAGFDLVFYEGYQFLILKYPY